MLEELLLLLHIEQPVPIPDAFEVQFEERGALEDQRDRSFGGALIS